jgi:hypothetical protein
LGLQVSYTRHTARSLMMWLMTLPMALWPGAPPFCPAAELHA